MNVVQEQEHLLGLCTGTGTLAMNVVQEQEHWLGLWTGTVTPAINVVQAGALSKTVDWNRNTCY